MLYLTIMVTYDTILGYYRCKKCFMPQGLCFYKTLENIQKLWK